MLMRALIVMLVAASLAAGPGSVGAQAEVD